MQAENCIDPVLGRQIFRWAMLRSGLEREPNDVTLRDHIANCPACSTLVGQWQHKAEAGRLLVEGDRVLAGDLRSIERVVEKQLPDGRALFKFVEDDPSTGLMLLVGRDGRICAIYAQATRSQFETITAVSAE